MLPDFLFLLYYQFVNSAMFCIHQRLWILTFRKKCLSEPVIVAFCLECELHDFFFLIHVVYGKCISVT